MGAHLNGFGRGSGSESIGIAKRIGFASDSQVIKYSLSPLIMACVGAATTELKDM
jgi:hypothetical protein